MRSENMLTGIKTFDALGGLPEKSNILLIGPPGPEKMMLSIKLLSNNLNIGGKGVYITTDQLPQEIEQKSKKFAADLSQFTAKNLWFVDCYSWTLGKQLEERKDIVVPGPTALNDLSLGIAQSMQNAADSQSPSVIFQSVSTLLLYNNPEMVFRFVQILGSRLKFSNATTLLHLESSMHDEKVVTTMKHLADEVIELKSEDGKTMILSPMLGIRNWIELIF